MLKRKQNPIFLIFLAFILVFSLAGCSLDIEEDDDGQERTIEKKNSRKSSESLNLFGKQDEDSYRNLAINDFTVSKDDYIIETFKNSSYILLSSEIVVYPFKVPYSTDSYPDLSTENGQITLTWINEDEVFFRVDMVEGSHEAYINSSDEPIDIVVGPKTVDDKLYIPVNIIIEALEMEETYDRELDITLIHYKEDFPMEYLVGTWSDSDTNLFTVFEDAAGLESLSSFEMGYQFDEDGTYRIILVNVGGFNDALIQCKGKYKIMGNTIVYYDVLETLYEGNPFKLVHKNKKLEKPSFEFIHDYDPDKGKIDLGTSWLKKIEE